jgi:hypothetical protein
MTPDELRSQVDALRWYHTIDLGHGVVTKGVDNTPLRLARVDLPASLAGRSVLDIGAWDGFFVAADYYAWHGQGWGTGQGKAGFELARRALGSRVEASTSTCSISVPSASAARSTSSSSLACCITCQIRCSRSSASRPLRVIC